MFMREGWSAANPLFGAFLLALDRLQSTRVPEEDAMAAVALECVAMADPAAVECVLRHWTYEDSKMVMLWKQGAQLF